MPTENLKDIGLPQFAAGAAGALVSMRFITGTWFEKTTMALGGSALSFFGTVPLSNWLAISNAEGLLGFLIGLFGMALVSKVYEVIWLIDASRVAKDLWAAVARKWKA